MEFKIHPELKEAIEHHHEIVDLIEQYDIDGLYHLFDIDNPNRIKIASDTRNNLTELLIALDINPLNYITKLPTFYAYNIDINTLIIPSNINKIQRQSIQFCDINVLQIDAQTIDMSAYAIVDSNINKFICKSGIITTFEFARFTTLINNIGDRNTKFIFKQGALIQDGLRPGKKKIEDVITEYNLDDRYNIQLI